MRHSDHVANFGRNLGELVGHDILLMRSSNQVERANLIAEVGTEHIAARRWFRVAVDRVRPLLGSKVRGPEAGGCRSAPRSTPITRPPRVGQTQPASRHANVTPFTDDVERTPGA